MSQRGASALRPSIAAKSPIFIKPILVDSFDASSPSLLLTFEHSRYLFNCPENTSRSFVQSRIPQKNLSSIFLSSSRASHSAGTYGMLMGLADSHKQTVRLIGPDGLRYMLACGRLFTRRQGLSVRVDEFQPSSTFQQVFQDQYIRVLALGSGRPRDETHHHSLIRKRSPELAAMSSDVSHKRTKLEEVNSETKLEEVNSETKLEEVNSETKLEEVNSETKLGEVNSELPAGVQSVSEPQNTLEEIIDDMFRASGATRPPGCKSRTPAYSYERLQVPDEPFNTDPVSYLVIGPRLRGKFLPEKARRLGVKPGPDFAKLVNGESIQVNAENLVTSDMCVEGGSAGSAFLLSSIVSLDQLSHTTLLDPECVTRAIDGANLMAIYHFVHQDVILDERYIQWITKFGPETTVSVFSVSPSSPFMRSQLQMAVIC